jgi:hypothetical protein
MTARMCGLDICPVWPKQKDWRLDSHSQVLVKEKVLFFLMPPGQLQVSHATYPVDELCPLRKEKASPIICYDLNPQKYLQTFTCPSNLQPLPHFVRIAITVPAS